MANRDTIPHEDSETTARAQQAYSFLDVGVVTSSPEQTEDGAHHVTVAETRVPSDQPLPVIPSVHGDYYVPPEGSPVLVAYVGENDGVVVGTPVPDTQTPDVTPGERVISHPLSTSVIRFRDDGGVEILGQNGTAVELQADGTVVINGGTTGAITDVTIDSTNAEGGATGLNIERNDNVLL